MLLLHHEISSRKRRATTYGLVGKRLLLVYARALRAASARITKARRSSINVMIECPIVGTNDRISTSLTCRHGRRQPPCHPGNHGRKTAIRSTCSRRSPVGDVRHIPASRTHSALIEIALRRLFNDGERCVCARRYYFLAAMLPSFWRGGTCRWAVSPAAVARWRPT